MGHMDFAGGSVVHVNAGVSALVICIMLGPRLGLDTSDYKPSNLKLMILGTALLWFGWLGFNGGNAKYKNGILGLDLEAPNAYVVTNLSAMLGGITWMLI